MLQALLISLAVLLLAMMLALAFLLGWRLRRRQEEAQELSAVTRQHIDLFQGGQLSEAAVEAAKSRFRELLERGDWQAVENSLRPGTHFVVQVRALAELGTDDAGRILERQLQKRLTNDVIEQSWYWIDLANGLRSLQREQSLPQLLRCAETGGDHPLSHFFAAETVCFLSFAGYLRRHDSPLGQTALRVLHRALEGLRCGLPPQVVIEARLGEVIEELWDHKPEQAHPLVARVFAEALRVLRRAPHAEVVLGEEHYEQEAYGWQMSHLASLEGLLDEYLEDAPEALAGALPTASPDEQQNLLTALDDLRGEAAPAALVLLETPGFAHAELAVRTLTWSRDPRVGPWLRAWICRHVSVARRATGRRLRTPPRAPTVTAIPYAAALRALKGHVSSESEALLVAAAGDWDPRHRAAAVSALGWWEPLERARVLGCLQESRRDPNADVRQAARAALARLGEVQALAWFRQGLSGQDGQRIHETIQTAAAEGLFLLWPDLDRLADTENVDVALHACEALERLREDLPFRRE